MVAVHLGQLMVAAGAAFLIPPQGYVIAAIIVPFAGWSLARELRKP